MFDATDTTREGYYGAFGGAFIPETLFAPVAHVTAAFDAAIADPSFIDELRAELRDFVGRPTALTRVERLERAWGSPGPIALKREDLAHTGAHKINNSMGQVLLARRMGRTRIIAETGAGQHGVATATACARLGLSCVVYMGEVDMQRQALNVFRMRVLGAEVRGVASGSRTLKDAINEAMRDWAGDPDRSYYCIGSALGPHPWPRMVRFFQSVIGIEARRQWLDRFGALPDGVVACIGGGSNSIGVFSAFIGDGDVRLWGAEAGGRGPGRGEHAARFAGGHPGVLHGTRTWLLQDDDGQVLPTDSISAGLDYPAIGPEHANLQATGRATYLPVLDADALASFHELARLEGLLPALESAHGVALARALVRDGRVGPRGLLINLSGRGDKDVETVRSLEAGETA
jgi:tryptophan synthase beta chain